MYESPRAPRPGRLLSTRSLRGLRWVGLGGALAVVIVLVLSAVTGAGTVGGVLARAIDGDDASEQEQTRQSDLHDTDDGSLHDLATLVAQYGEPPYADIGRLRIPLIGLDAPISVMLVGEDGVMPTPQSPIEVAWYDLSGFPGVGGRPGEGNAVFAAHVDRVGPVDYAGVQYSGPAAFWHLALLGTGDEIELDFAGATLRYRVSFAQEVDAGSAGWADVLSDSHGDTITLITCSGAFDLAGGYSHRTVVRAERIA